MNCKITHILRNYLTSLTKICFFNGVRSLTIKYTNNLCTHKIFYLFLLPFEILFVNLQRYFKQTENGQRNQSKEFF